MKRFFVLMAVIMLAGSPQYLVAQTKLGKALGAGAALIDGLMSNKKSKTQNNTNSNNLSSDSESDRMTSKEAYVQQKDGESIRIITGHPDLKVKVKRCEASGKILIIDLTFTNVGTSDIDDFTVEGGSYHHGSTTDAIDDQGNTYAKDQVTISAGSDPSFDCYYGRDISLIPDVPIKVRVRIEGVSTYAETIARLRVFCKSKSLAFDLKHFIDIRNIPISRDE